MDYKVIYLSKNTERYEHLVLREEDIAIYVQKIAEDGHQLISINIREEN